nr:PREDICTED: probable LRR receptor-like serine/threonine-protein kinase At3g47570 isoform X2 [Daucus carota subsp. sativus]
MFSTNSSNLVPFSLLHCATMFFNILFFLVLVSSTTFVYSFSNNVTDQQALLSFKVSITGPLGVLDSWNDSIHFCHWTGVTCNRKRQRVTALDLSLERLVGKLSPHIGNLSFLRTLYLYENNLYGMIPNEIGRLSRLRHLSLGNNSFQGRFPDNLLHCRDITFINLDNNHLEGKLPTDFSFWSKLDKFFVTSNHINGSIPPSIGNISSLRALNLGGNNLFGEIPSELGHLAKLEDLDLTQNRFSGNNITGPIPNNLGSLPDIQVLGLGQNLLGENMRPNDWSFFDSLVNCTHLTRLGLHESSLRGELPNSIANLSTTLEGLYLYGNYIYGSIPHEIGKLVNLKVLNFGDNLLTGIIPQSIGRLSKLGRLTLYDNNITGAIPTIISNFTELVTLYLYGNMLQGSIPTQLFNISTLEKVFLDNNQLRGAIPKEIVLLSHCIVLYLNQNLFNGPLPANIGSLKQLVEFDVSNNKLRGYIPNALGDCVMLETLYMEGNLFQGKIPSSFRALKNLAYLDLSNNNISGSIPSFFDGFRQIIFLNLSHNKLEGEVSNEGLFLKVGAFSLDGNSELCGGIKELHLPACPEKALKNKKKAFSWRIILILILVPIGMVLACLLLITYRRRNSKKKLNGPVLVLKDDQYPKLSYQDLLLATNEFSPDNLIGEGRYGSVYKGHLESVEQVVAVKVLNGEIHGANKTFLAECETLRNIRHRNLIKIITACSSIDFKGNDFKALVFDFMTNGSLDSWLHPGPFNQSDERNLSLLQRLNISIDVALGVDYLHHHTHESIIHCDLKPSNILLDENFVARIGDFGLARFCFSNTSTSTGDINQAQTSSSGIRGTIGYVPPEYGMFGEISAEGDVYSFGILLLEMFSGKRPTDDDNNLHDFVKKALPQRVMDIVDPRIILNQEHGMTIDPSYSGVVIEVCLKLIFEVGILCSEVTPRERIDIGVAIKQLRLARDKLVQGTQ